MKEQIKDDYSNTTATGAAWDFLQVKVSLSYLVCSLLVPIHFIACINSFQTCILVDLPFDLLSQRSNCFLQGLASTSPKYAKNTNGAISYPMGTASQIFNTGGIWTTTVTTMHDEAAHVYSSGQLV